jgi:hypothetical protein
MRENEWIEAANPLDSGVRLSDRVIDWAWRGEAVATAYAEHRSLRKVGALFGLNHEKVRALVAKFHPLPSKED